MSHSEVGGIKKPHRKAPGVKALRDIKHLQKTTNLLIPYAPFRRLVDVLSQDYKSDLRFSRMSVEVLRQSLEAYLTGLLEDSGLIALHLKRVTANKNDVRTAYTLRGDHIKYGNFVTSRNADTLPRKPVPKKK
jgi:histone H3